jgi:hypothetical protein
MAPSKNGLKTIKKNTHLVLTEGSSGMVDVDHEREREREGEREKFIDNQIDD